MVVRTKSVQGVVMAAGTLSAIGAVRHRAVDHGPRPAAIECVPHAQRQVREWVPEPMGINAAKVRIELLLHEDLSRACLPDKSTPVSDW